RRRLPAAAVSRLHQGIWRRAVDAIRIGMCGCTRCAVPCLTLPVDDGIVVSRSGRNEIEMRANRAPAALRERLGHEGTIGLYEVFETEEVAWGERVLNLAAERFERRLAEEI